MPGDRNVIILDSLPPIALLICNGLFGQNKCLLPSDVIWPFGSLHQLLGGRRPLDWSDTVKPAYPSCTDVRQRLVTEKISGNRTRLPNVSMVAGIPQLKASEAALGRGRTVDGNVLPWIATLMLL